MRDEYLRGRRDVLKRAGIATPLGVGSLAMGSQAAQASDEPDYSIVKDYQMREIDDGDCGLNYMPNSVDHKIIGVDVVLGSAATTASRSAIATAIGAAIGGKYGAVLGAVSSTFSDIIFDEELGENDTIMCGLYDDDRRKPVPVPTPFGTIWTRLRVPVIRGGVYYYPEINRLPTDSTSELADGDWVDTFSAAELLTDYLQLGGINFPFDPPDVVGHIDLLDT